MVAWGASADGSGQLVPCDDAGLYNTLDDIVDWAQGVLDAGNAEYIDIMQGNIKIKTLYPKGALIQ